jgi:hypothetical protein
MPIKVFVGCFAICFIGIVYGFARGKCLTSVAGALGILLGALNVEGVIL